MATLILVFAGFVLIYAFGTLAHQAEQREANRRDEEFRRHSGGTW